MMPPGMEEPPNPAPDAQPQMAKVYLRPTLVAQ